MSNEFFSFKQFTIFQDRCAMKVGTDGTLLGAWASIPEEPQAEMNESSIFRRSSPSSPSSHNSPPEVLDIGTGTGLIALMIAQRFPQAHITAIDIDEQAIRQAKENVAASPFSDQISVLRADFREFRTGEEGIFDAIVTNPPYFVSSLACPSEQRTMARHTSSLSYQELLQNSFRLLRENGVFSMIIPMENFCQMETEVALAGFFITKKCSIRTMPEKAFKRCMIELRKHPVKQEIITEETINTSPNVRSEWYHQLTKDFYLK